MKKLITYSTPKKLRVEYGQEIIAPAKKQKRIKVNGKYVRKCSKSRGGHTFILQEIKKYIHHPLDGRMSVMKTYRCLDCNAKDVRFTEEPCPTETNE